MRPYKFSILPDGFIRYHYRFSELREFLTLGFAEGNVGWILIGRIGNLKIFKGFGTYENPVHSMQRIYVQHWDMFDGPMPSDEKICAPVDLMTKNKMFESHGMVLLDFSKHEKGKLLFGPNKVNFSK